ncbi:TPA: hypothetical protein L4U31_002827 [Pseudomonas aeruginosa]|nr:hypothetical protein [Pseudomonas aeruginosa]
MDYLKLSKKLLEHEPAHSIPFIEGMAAILHNRVDRTPVTSPYAAGTAEDDAFFAGRMRAHNEFRNLLEECNGDHDAAIDRLRALAGAAQEVA